MANKEILDSNNIIYDKYLPNPYPYPAQGGGTQTLAQTLTLGNITGANDILMTDGLNKTSIKNAQLLEADTIKVDTIKAGIGALSDVVKVEANLNIKEGVTTGLGVLEFELCDGIIATQGTNTLTLDTNTLKIDGITATSGVSNLLTYDTLSKEVKYQPTPTFPTPSLSQVLTVGNTSGANDILMDAGQKIKVETLENDTKMITIKSENTSANTSTKATFDTTSGGSAINIEAKNTTTNTTANATFNSITKTAKLSVQDTPNIIISEFSCDASLPAINTSMSLIQANAGVVRRIELGVVNGVDYTKVMGLTAPPTSLSKVIAYDPATDYIYQQDIPAPSINNVAGTYVVQEEIPTATSTNDQRILINNGIDTPYQINPLYIDADSNIPFFNKDGTPFPNLSVSVASAPWSGLIAEAPNNSLQIRCFQTNPYTGVVYVGGYDGGSNKSMIYTFNPSLNQWSQLIYIGGEVLTLLYDDETDILYFGGDFPESQITPGVSVFTKYIGCYNPTTGLNLLQSGLNNKVYCLAKWNGYIAIGGSFSGDNSTTNQLECFALYLPSTNDFYHIGQAQTTTPSQFGFNDAVMTLAVLPQTNILVVGGLFGEQFYNGTSTSYQFITSYTLLTGFSQISNGSLIGDVNKLFADYEGKRLYLWGTFTTSISGTDYFTALPINNLEADFIPMVGYPFGGANYYSAITKDEIGGYIWLFNNNEGQIWRYNPINDGNTAFEYMNTVLSIPDDFSYGYYSWFDKSIHIGIVAGDGYYRTFCDQRVKVKVPDGETISYNGNKYNTIVLPKKGSSVTVKGNNTTQVWNVLNYTNGVYFEWDTAQIKQVEPAYATVLFTGEMTGIGSPKIIEWSSSTGRNISITGVASTKIQVQQKGLYKMSYSTQLDNTGGSAIQAYIWFIVNDKKYQRTNTVFVVNGPNDETAPFVETYVELDIGDYVGLVVDSPSGTLSIPSQVATADRPAIPGIIFNIQMVQPSAQFFYP